MDNGDGVAYSLTVQVGEKTIGCVCTWREYVVCYIRGDQHARYNEVLRSRHIGLRDITMAFEQSAV